ncbi:hypothetical protein PG994_002222 [Apiospora phragmitis]|uniref:Uncharacterized protein n=1 Tax=Apiospora phragmitis TaxID=2905665 RepID=A0ABR1WVQ5_9PEZI
MITNTLLLYMLFLNTSSSIMNRIVAAANQTTKADDAGSLSSPAQSPAQGVVLNLLQGRDQCFDVFGDGTTNSPRHEEGVLPAADELCGPAARVQCTLRDRPPQSMALAGGGRTRPSSSSTSSTSKSASTSSSSSSASTSASAAVSPTATSDTTPMVNIGNGENAAAAAAQEQPNTAMEGGSIAGIAVEVVLFFYWLAWWRGTSRAARG